MYSRFLATAGLILVTGLVRADDAADARAIIDKAMDAMGGEALLSKYKAFTTKMKGEVHTQGTKIPFTGDVFSQGADQQKIVLDLEVAGQKFNIVQVLNKDRGWVKTGEDLKEMDKDKLKESLEEGHAGWVASLTPLKDKAFTLATIGEVKVEDKPAVGIRVSHKDRRDVSLFFDKKTHLLVKSETRVKDEESGQEVTEENFMSGYDGKEIKSALKMTIKRDGKLYLEAELSDVKLEEKLDDQTFAKP